MKIQMRALALAAFASAGALAQGSSSPDAVQAGTFAFDDQHTLVRFSVNHFGFNEYFGALPGASGTLTLDPHALASTKLDITLPVDRLSTTNATLDAELKGSDWFDVSRYPTAHFVSRKVVKTGPRTATIEGSLTMHGITRPLTLSVNLGGAGVNPMTKAYTVGFQATGTLNRSDFGVTKYVPMVSDKVDLAITAAVERQP